MNIRIFKGSSLPPCVREAASRAIDAGLLLQWNGAAKEATIKCEHTGEMRQVKALPAAIIQGQQTYSISVSAIRVAVTEMLHRREVFRHSIAMTCKATRMRLGVGHPEHGTLCQLERLVGDADNETLGHIIWLLMEIEEEGS